MVKTVPKGDYTCQTPCGTKLYYFNNPQQSSKASIIISILEEEAEGKGD